MVVIAVLAIVFGSAVWAQRLKQRRDEFLARASGHSAQEATYGRLVTDSVSARFPEETAAVKSDSPSEKRIAVPVNTIARWLGIADAESDPKSTAGNDRFQAAKARSSDMSERGRALWLNYMRRQATYHRRTMEYHSALKRKYLAAAARPWIAVAPDPPKPTPTRSKE
jgi:hypothetical protein